MSTIVYVQKYLCNLAQSGDRAAYWRHVPLSRASSFLLIGKSSFKSRKQTEFRETEESVDQPSEVMECFVFRLKNQYLDLNLTVLSVVILWKLPVSKIGRVQNLLQS